MHNARKCEYEGCSRLGATLGARTGGKRGRFCKKHRAVGPKHYPSDSYKRVDSSQRRCKIDGCNRLAARQKNRPDGSIRRSKLCGGHREDGRRVDRRGLRELLEKRYGSRCQLCKWEGPCDLHRKIPGSKGGKYVLENVMFICPNCHRLEHYEEWSKIKMKT